MLTKAGKVILNYFGVDKHLPKPTYTVGSNNYAVIAGKDCLGNNYAFGPSIESNNNVLNSLSGSGSNAPQGFAFGSGTTPVTDDDYTMESLITTISGATTGPTTYYDSTNNKYHTYLQFTLTNTGSETITISEIGRFWQVFTASNVGDQCGGYGSQRGLLVDHVLLDEPVVIAAGESGIVRYEATYN